MDKALGTNKRPSLSEVVEWLSEQRAASSEHLQSLSLVALSIHGPWKEWFQDMKSTAVTLVYLRKPKEQLKEHLSERPECDQEYTLKTYDCLDAIFTEAAEYKIDCANKDTAAVAAEVIGVMNNAGG
jgi:hypothetical protein